MTRPPKTAEADPIDALRLFVLGPDWHKCVNEVDLHTVRAAVDEVVHASPRSGWRVIESNNEILIYPFAFMGAVLAVGLRARARRTAVSIEISVVQRAGMSAFAILASLAAGVATNELSPDAAPTTSLLVSAFVFAALCGITAVIVFASGALASRGIAELYRMRDTVAHRINELSSIDTNPTQ